jgi:phosphoribosyl-ATP pyrophosphohydrolase
MIDERDITRMVQLAREGKQIKKINEEDFPEYNYWEIYEKIYGAGEKSALGVKKMITMRLNKLTTVTKKEQPEIISEIADLVEYLYVRHKESQVKLDEIRSIIES